MVDPVVHAKMTMLKQQEKKLNDELDGLEKEIPLWQGRVELATQKGMADLARQAGVRVQELQERRAEIAREFEVLEMDKGMLRYEARRPSGIELQRSEAMLDEVRLGGLVDPDASDRPGSDMSFDFNEED